MIFIQTLRFRDNKALKVLPVTKVNGDIFFLFENGNNVGIGINWVDTVESTDPNYVRDYCVTLIMNMKFEIVPSISVNKQEYSLFIDKNNEYYGFDIIENKSKTIGGFSDAYQISKLDITTHSLNERVIKDIVKSYFSVHDIPISKNFNIFYKTDNTQYLDHFFNKWIYRLCDEIENQKQINK